MKNAAKLAIAVVFLLRLGGRGGAEAEGNGDGIRRQKMVIAKTSGKANRCAFRSPRAVHARKEKGIPFPALRPEPGPGFIPERTFRTVVAPASVVGAQRIAAKVLRLKGLHRENLFASLLRVESRRIFRQE